jgi:small subunit ribosomal protein S20
MANHKSALKRIRQNEARRIHNRYFARSMRNSVRKFRLLTAKKEAEEQMPKIFSIIDKMAKKNIIHKKKAGNIKSSIAKYANSLS